MSVDFSSIFTNKIEQDINGVINADDQKKIVQEFNEYVITNEVANCLDNFFEKYNTQKPDYNGVWISGFFGCGKSHLLKILSYLVSNTEIEEGKKPVSYFEEKLRDNPYLLGQIKKAASIPSESVLFNVVQYNQNNTNDPLLHIFQRKFYEHCGYCGSNLKIAALEMELDNEGLFDIFKETFKINSSKEWNDARKRPNINKKYIIKTFAEVTGNPVNDNLLDQYTEDISIHDFATQVNEYIEHKGNNFRLNFFVDEVGQFVAHSSRLMVDLQEIATSLSSVTGNKSWMFVTSQDEIEKFVNNFEKQDKTDLSKIQGRFYVKMPLSNANVNEVIQKRLLEKNETGKAIVGSTYNIQKDNFNTLFQFVNGPKKYRVYRDENEFVSTYPFVTYQFDMFKTSLEMFSLHNAFPGDYTSTGARSMLDIFHKVLRSFVRNEHVKVGTSLIPYDAMYDDLKGMLKENFKKSIDVAENNITDNPFAIRVLKALLLVKYLQKEFKPTAHNLSVLLIDSFDTNTAELVEKTEEALNRLTKETYIQRNGDTYDFLTDEEKDVEEEIKADYVPPADLTDELNNIIYKKFLSRISKVADERKVVEYPFTRRLDNEVVGSRNSEISLNILTPFQSGDRHPNYLDTLTCPDTELVVLLQSESEESDKRISDDFLLYLQTNRYVKNHSGDNLSDDRRKVIVAKSDRNKERLKEIESKLKDMLSESDIYISGEKINVKPSSDIDSRIGYCFKRLIEKVYPNLRMIDKTSASEINAKELIDGNLDNSLFNEGLTEAENQILNHLRQNKIVITVSNLVEKFTKKPFGWPVSALIYNLVLLMKKGQINIKINGKVTENAKALKDFLFSSAQYSYIVIELCKSIELYRIKKVKKFIYELSGYKCTYDDPKSVSTQAFNAIKKVQDELKEFTNNYDFPFIKNIKEKMAMLDDILVKDSYWIFSDDFISNISEKILDDADNDYLSFISFMNNVEALDKYKEASNLVEKYASFASNLDKETLDTITNILNDKVVYRSSDVSRLPKLVNNLKNQISSAITKMRDYHIEQFDQDVKNIKNKSAYKYLSDTEKENLDNKISDIRRNISRTASPEDFTNITGVEMAFKSEIEEVLKKGEQRAKEKKIIKIESLSSARVTSPITTVDGVKKYIKDLENELIKKIEEGYTVE